MHSPITPETLTHLAAVEAAMTPGPWAPVHSELGSLVTTSDPSHWVSHCRRVDAEGIAAMRNAFPDLLREVVRLQKEWADMLWDRNACADEWKACRVELARLQDAGRIVNDLNPRTHTNVATEAEWQQYRDAMAILAPKNPTPKAFRAAGHSYSKSHERQAPANDDTPPLG